MKRHSLVLSLTLLLTSVALAQTSVENARGFKAVIPKGLKVQANKTEAAATNTANTYALSLKAHNYQSFQAFAEDSDLEADGLTLETEPVSVGNGQIHFRVSTFNEAGNKVFIDSFFGLNPKGRGGSIVLVISNLKAADEGYRAGLQVAKSLKYFAPVAQAPGSSPWDRLIRGKHLVYLNTGNGFSERFDLYLFTNGQFSTRSDMSSVSMNGSGAVAGGADGVWEISGNELVLSYNDGRTSTLTIAKRQASNEISLNGRRYFIMNS